MPLRNDPTLAWNLPGCVAYYQPVVAPDSLLARYNMAHGGDNRYRAEPGTMPTWSPVTGWGYTGTQYLSTGYVVPNDQSHSMLIRYSNLTGNDRCVAFSRTGTNIDFGFYIATTENYYFSGQSTSVAPRTNTGVLGISGNQGFRNGIADGGSIASQAGTATAVMWIGAGNDDGAPVFRPISVQIQGFLLLSRRLSPAEMWAASRQMAYCNVNPDWSVWSPRRKWFPYVLAGGGFQAAWAAHSNSQVGTGVS